MTAQLREELDALADTQSFSPDPAAWDRGRRARRRGRVVAVAAVLVLVASVGGLAAAWTAREPVAPAGRVDGGAIPSRIDEPTGDTVTDLAFGPASVAYVDSDARPVLVSATTGESHRVELPDFPGADVYDFTDHYRRGSWLALSPDGTRLVYPTVTRFEREPGQDSFMTGWYRVVDLTTGESDLVDLPPSTGTPLAMSFTADGQIAVDVYDKGRIGKPRPDVISWSVDQTGSSTRPLIGVTAPGGGVSATYPGPDTAPESPDAQDLDAPVRAVRFVTSSGPDLSRDLPADDYPDGATVQPIGWADDSLLVAEVGADLVLFTSPDRPQSEWVWRTLVNDVPEGFSLSAAVDLVPDLTGDPDQELTHDFTAEEQMGDSSGAVRTYVALATVALLAGGALVGGLARRRA